MEAMFKNSFDLEKPVLYADVNVFRYLTYGELEIINPDRFIWAYSSIHLDEMQRGGNTDALDGMKSLKAVEVQDVLDDEFQSVGNVRIFDYVDPSTRYQSHIEATAGYGDAEDILIEHLLRIFGADNFKELSMTPEKLIDQVESLTANIEGVRQIELRKKVTDVSDQMAESISEHLADQMPIDTTRKALGLTNKKREDLKNSSMPIDDIWELLRPAVGEIDKDVFFGFKPNPVTPEIPHNQHSAIGGAHVILNMIGFSPDKGLANRNKIKNIMSDSQHVGLASYCQGLLSSDLRMCNKANAIYQYVGSASKALHYKYDPSGTVVNLGIQAASSAT